MSSGRALRLLGSFAKESRYRSCASVSIIWIYLQYASHHVYKFCVSVCLICIYLLAMYATLILEKRLIVCKQTLWGRNDLQSPWIATSYDNLMPICKTCKSLEKKTFVCCALLQKRADADFCVTVCIICVYLKNLRLLGSFAKESQYTFCVSVCSIRTYCARAADCQQANPVG